MQEVILLEDMPNLGKIGSLVRVRPGYARNYLVPNSLAMVASLANKRQLEHYKRVANFKRVKEEAAAKAAAAKMDGMILIITRKVGEQDKLFGSVTTQDIEAALNKAGVFVDRRKLELKEPIKQTGSYEIGIRLAQDLHASIKLNVVADTK